MLDRFTKEITYEYVRDIFREFNRKGDRVNKILIGKDY